MSREPMDAVHRFTDAHMANGTKGAVHGSLLTIAAGCVGYNYSAWRAERHATKPDVQRKRHLFWNWVLYLLLVIFEGYQIGRHASRR